MDALDAPDRLRRFREGMRPVGLERLRLGGIAVPDIDLMAVVQHAADKPGPHQAGAEKCDLHPVLLFKRLGEPRFRHRAPRAPALQRGSARLGAVFDGARRSPQIHTDKFS